MVNIWNHGFHFRIHGILEQYNFLAFHTKYSNRIFLTILELKSFRCSFIESSKPVSPDSNAVTLLPWLTFEILASKLDPKEFYIKSRAKSFALRFPFLWLTNFELATFLCWFTKAFKSVTSDSKVFILFLFFTCGKSVKLGIFGKDGKLEILGKLGIDHCPLP